MNVNVYFECPKCGAENEVDFDVGDHFCDLGECPECGHVFSNDEITKIYGGLEEQAISRLTDSAENYYGDR